ncbi:MAG: peptidylprolyl isomerase [Acidobacteriaceae bacterium]|jgi:peptidyl-prolyl cis-trans isomerase SurA
MKGRIAISVVCAALAAGSGPVRAQTQPAAAPSGAVQLDHVVASIGTSVILESDVREEMRLSALEPLRVLPGQDTPDSALRRLIDRTLILEQMNVQQQPVSTPLPQVQKALEQLGREIPECSRYHCDTEKGWESFLQAHDLTPELVDDRWSQRMAILRFIDMRFRAGIRISKQQIADYYSKTLLPALAKAHQPAPPLADVSPRIEEILLQQQVSSLFQDWLGSLRDEGDVRIVDPAYTGDLNLQNGAGSE